MSRINSGAGRHGVLKLAFAKRNEGTVLAESFFRVPLQVMKPRYDESGYACVYLLSPTGGVVQGDDYRIDVTLLPHSHATLTTQAATKVYAMPMHGAAQSLRGRIGKNAIFEYLPDPTILFRDANFSQRSSFNLARGAMLALQEIVMPGRLARGEKLAFTHYRSHLEVSDSEGMLLFDSCLIQPEFQPHLTSHGALDEYACWGSWFLLGDFEMPHWDALCEFAEPLLNQVDRSTGGLTRLNRNGIAMRMLAHNSGVIQSAFQTVWNWLKQEHLGLEAIDLRKY